MKYDDIDAYVNALFDKDGDDGDGLENVHGVIWDEYQEALEWHARQTLKGVYQNDSLPIIPTQADLEAAAIAHGVSAEDVRRMREHAGSQAAVTYHANAESTDDASGGRMIVIVIFVLILKVKC